MVRVWNFEYGGGLPLGAAIVYDDSGTGAPTPLPRTSESYGIRTALRADPAHRYLIGVGCGTTAACWPSFVISIATG